MALAAGHAPDVRHPWLNDFARDPIAAFGELLSGYAAIFPYDRADAPDAARMLFGPLPADDPLRTELDKAVIGWLAQRRKEPLPLAHPKLQRAVREISEALEIVAVLELANAALDLRRRFVIWNEWLARLVLSPARDAKAQYWRTLALTQPLVAASQGGPASTGLEPLWQRICREAGEALPKHYLDIGLLGLRRLPLHVGDSSEMPWLAGLAHWAQERNPSDAEFDAEWLALRALYPRAPHHWRELVSRLLSTPTFSHFQPPASWVAERSAGGGPAAGRRAPARSPLPREAQSLIARLHEPFVNLEPRLDDIFRRHRDFVTQTGDARYFVRAAHVIGRALIERGGDNPHGRARMVQLLAREGLSWEPYDPFLWSLWRNALIADGEIEAAELIGWEKVRRLPANPEASAELAGLLARQGERHEEAKALYRYSIKRFPTNPYFRAQLAELLLLENRLSDATTIVDELFTNGIQDVVSYALRARLLANVGDQQGAIEAVEEGLALEPSNGVLLDLQERLDQGQQLPLRSAEEPVPASSSEVPAEDEIFKAVIRSGKMRRLRFRLETQTVSVALSELRQIFEQDPTFAYAQLLAARQGIWRADSTALPTFAAAFEDALRTEDREKLEQLAQSQPRLDALILVARAVLGDAEAAKRIEDWLHTQPATEERGAVAVLRAGLGPVLFLIDNGSEAPDAFRAARETVLTVLHDANEAGLDEDIPLAA